MKLPLCLYFLDINHYGQACNEMNLNTCRYQSIKDYLNNTIHKVATQQSAKISIQHDLDVFKTNKMKIIEKDLSFHDGSHINSIAIKVPWYNSNNEIHGIFGCTFQIGGKDAPSLASSLSAVAEIGLLNTMPTLRSTNQITPGLQVGDVYLSKRELECLRHFARGKSVKATAALLKISPYTVGHYLQSIKFKMGVTYKNDLIDKTIGYIFS